jgi:hypothetical protein
MVPIPKVAGVLSCGFLLSLGLSHAVQAGDVTSAAEDMKAGPSERKGGQVDQGEMGFQLKSLHTVQGEMWGFNCEHYFVHEQDGKNVSLHADQTTSVTGKSINPGDRIEAIVDENNHVLSIHSVE